MLIALDLHVALVTQPYGGFCDGVCNSLDARIGASSLPASFCLGGARAGFVSRATLSAMGWVTYSSNVLVMVWVARLMMIMAILPLLTRVSSSFFCLGDPYAYVSLPGLRLRWSALPVLAPLVFYGVVRLYSPLRTASCHHLWWARCPHCLHLVRGCFYLGGVGCGFDRLVFSAHLHKPCSIGGAAYSWIDEEHPFL